MRGLVYYPSRKVQTRKNFFKNKKKHIIIITNFWLLYLIFMIFIPLTNDTHSYFNDTGKISNSFIVSDNFCADQEYAKNHKDECKKCKDNSGFGNGPECNDVGNEPDNPSTGNEDKKDCPAGGCVDDHPNKLIDPKFDKQDIPNNPLNTKGQNSIELGQGEKQGSVTGASESSEKIQQTINNP